MIHEIQCQHMALLAPFLPRYSNAAIPNLGTSTEFTQNTRSAVAHNSPSKSKLAIEKIGKSGFTKSERFSSSPALLSLGETNQQPLVLFPACQHHSPFPSMGLCPVPWISSLKISWTPINLNYCLSWAVFAYSHIFPGLRGCWSSSSQELSVQWWVSKGCGGESRELLACVRKPFCELHVAGSRSVSLSACFYHQPCSSRSHLLITRGWHPAPFSTAIPALYLLQAHYDPR